MTITYDPIDDTRMPMPTAYRSHLNALEAESIHIIREVAAEFERPVLLFTGGKDSIVMLHLAEKAFWPGPHPVPGDARRHRPQLRRGHRVPRPPGGRARRPPGRRLRPGVHRRRPGGRGDRAQGQPQPAADRDPARRHRGAPLRRRVRRRPARRGEGPGQGARVLSFRDEFGQWDPKNQRPELWSLYNGRHRKGEHIRVFPLSATGPSSTSGSTSPTRTSSCRRSTTPTAARCSSATACCWPCTPFVTVLRRRGASRAASCATAPSATPRCTGAVESTAATVDDGDRRGRRHPHHRARRHPRRRPVQPKPHGRPQEGGLLLMPSCLRFATAGSVDDGKSTLIGRLLLRLEGDLRGPARGRRAHQPRATGFDYTNLALLTDGLRAEREQGITIDVAYRYFATPKRKFIIADTPGHVQYTRNMVTGASTADLALDARRRPQGHARADPAPRLPRVAAADPAPRAVRQQDGPRRLRRGRLRGDQGRVPRLRRASSTIADLTFIPISALHGDNVVDRTRPTCPGTRALAAAPPREVHIASDRNLIDARFPVQYVIRPDERTSTTTTAATPARSPAACSSPATRSWCCRRASRPRDRVDRHVRTARSTRRSPPMSVTIRLADDIDISRGDMICRPAQPAARSARTSTRWSAG